MQALYWEMDQDPVPKCIARLRSVVYDVRGFLSYVLTVRNRCLLTVLLKMAAFTRTIHEVAGSNPTGGIVFSDCLDSLIILHLLRSWSIIGSLIS